MFIESELTWTIAVKPSDLKSGAHIQRALLTKLLTDFNKLKCSEKHGYYLCVTTLEGVGEGRVWEGKGCVSYRVTFRCLSYKPQKHEKVFAVVKSEIVDKGIICSFGPIDDLFISQKLQHKYKLVAESSTSTARLQHSEDGTIIEKGTVLRVEIIGFKFNSLLCTFEVIGSLMGDDLGVDPRVWEDKSKPPEAVGGGPTWGAENGGEDWQAVPAQETMDWADAPGGVTAAAAEKNNSDGGWNAPSANEDAGGWNASPVKESGDWGTAVEKVNGGGGWGAAPASETTGAWDVTPAKTTNNAGGWDASPVKESEDWGAAAVEKVSGGGGWGAAPASETTGAWDVTPAKTTGNAGARSVPAGGWDSADPVKESAGGWDSAPPEETNSGGGWGL